MRNMPGKSKKGKPETNGHKKDTDVSDEYDQDAAPDDVSEKSSHGNDADDSDTDPISPNKTEGSEDSTFNALIGDNDHKSEKKSAKKSQKKSLKKSKSGNSKKEKSGKRKREADEESALEAASDVEGSDKEEKYESVSKKSKHSSKKLKSPAKESRKEKSSKRKKAASESEEEGAGEEYEVEKIVEMKEHRGKRQFLVRWKGYSPSSDTWEAEDSLSCPEIIKTFLDSLPNKKDEQTPKKSEKASKKSPKKGKSKKGKSPVKSQDNSDDDGEEKTEEFEVEKILEVHNKKNGKHEFLIRWKGFAPKDDTWEPEEHLNCQELIAKFMERVEKKKALTERELRVLPKHTDRFTLSMNQSGRRLSRRSEGKQRATYHEQE